MRNIKILFILLLFFAAGCKDYLEEENPGNILAEDFYLTTEGYQR